MAKSTVQWLEREGLRIAASVDVEEACEHDLYNPFTALAFVQQGSMNVLRGSRMEHYRSGDLVLVRKFTTGKYFKTWGPGEGAFRMLAFLFQDDLIAEVVDQLPAGAADRQEMPPLVQLPATAELRALMGSLAVYFAAGKPVAPSLLRLKTLEAVLSVVAADPRTAAVFRAFAQPLRADLGQFMERFILEKMNLEELARLSGRSLSDFNRAFRDRFGMPPHRWIKQQRLEKARDMLVREGRKPVDVYLASGFEDLAHFSRSFKRQFGRNPSEMVAGGLA